MTRDDYLRAIAAKTGIAKKDIKVVLNTAGEVAFENMSNDRVPVFTGLTLTSGIQSARTARNPRTGEAIEVPEKKKPKAVFGQRVKDMLNS